MKKFLTLAPIAVLVLLASVALQAQENPFVGTWKLNVAKSTFAGTAAPKSETRIVVASGSGLKLSFEGVAADGSKISWIYSTNLDGKPMPATGSGVPSGADTLITKRIDANNLTTTYLKAGKEVRTSRTTTDGKVTTVTAKLTDASGKPITVATVWEKQ